MAKDWVFDVGSNNWVESETPVKTIFAIDCSDCGLELCVCIDEPIIEAKPITTPEVKRRFDKSKKLTRPNDKCLNCDNPNLKTPTTMRSFKYCSKLCKDQANKGIKALSMNGMKKQHGRRNGRNTRDLCLTYYILRTRDEPLDSAAIIYNARELFGDKKLGRRASNFNNFFWYFSNVRKVKINGKNHFEIIDKSLPFNKSLKEKYNKVVFGE